MQKFPPALFYFFAELALVIGKISKRSRSGKLLSLKQHRCLRTEKKQCRDCPVERRVRHTLDPPAATAISNLIVILQIVDKGRRLDTPGWGATAFLLPAVVLSLIEVTVFGSGNE